jgi:hypothetical protein
LTVIKNFTSYSRKVYCTNCKKYYAMNDDVQGFLPWDSDFARFYRELYGDE